MAKTGTFIRRTASFTAPENTEVKLVPLFLFSLWLRDFLLPEGAGVSQSSASGSLLYGTFWTVWERGTLLSRAVKQLTQLLVQAAVEVNTVELLPDSLCWMVCYIGQQKCQLGQICGRIRKTKLLLLLLLDSNCDCYLFSLKDYGERDEKQELHLADTLLDLLSVLVEFWCQQHFKLNQNLVEKGLKDLAEHFAVISQGKVFFKKYKWKECLRRISVFSCPKSLIF